MALITATQIIPDVSFITAHVAYAAQIKQKSFDSLNLFRGADAPHAYVRAWTLCCFHSFF